MSSEPVSDIGKYLYVTSPLDSDARKFVLKELAGEEQISELFRYRLSMGTPDDEVAFTEIVGKSLTVFIYFQNGDVRYIHGEVTGFQQGDSDGRATTYYAELRPWLWHLTLTRNCKIFQDQSALQIIEAVFSAFGFSDYEVRTTGNYPPREYCVQYEETAFDFVSRLMEEEGIFYWFEHTADKHTLVMADAASGHLACPGLVEAHYAEVEPPVKDDHLIENLRIEESLVSHAYAVEDFHFITPQTDLLASVDTKNKVATASKKGGDPLRVYEYPGRYIKVDEGTAIATRRMQALEVEGKVIRGEGYCRAFCAGYQFTLAKHNRPDVDGDYVLRWLSISADHQRGYQNRFDAFPVDVPFRPPRRTAKPRIFGAQTAIVVGPAGEEIWPDDYGRVKVQFHWDQEGAKDEKSSCWIRVAQVWAGKGWGTLFTPRIGTEVIVSFLDGDPDRPIIIGTVYNQVQTVPYTQPDEKNKSTILTRSTKEGTAGNEIRFTDTKEKEELYVHAQKDYNIKVENDRKKEVLGKETITITKDRTTTITEGNESLTITKGTRTITVSKGSETHSVKDTRTLTVTKAETHTNKDAFTHSVKKDYVLNVDGDLTISVKGKITITSKDNVTIKASKKLLAQSGKSLTNKAGTALLNKAAKQLTNQAGTALQNKAGTALTNKAGTKLTNQAGLKLTNKGLTVETKGSASAKVDGGGMLTLKGGMVKIG